MHYSNSLLLQYSKYNKCVLFNHKFKYIQYLLRITFPSQIISFLLIDLIVKMQNRCFHLVILNIYKNAIESSGYSFIIMNTIA